MGSAIDMRQRRNDHFTKLRCNIHVNKYLQNSFNKYGESNFVVEIIEIVNQRNNLIRIEQKWLDIIKPFSDTRNGYNICKKADSPLGVKRSEKFKKHLSLINKGKKMHGNYYG